MTSRRDRIIDLAQRIGDLREALANAEAEMPALLLDRHTKPSIRMNAVAAPESASSIKTPSASGIKTPSASGNGES